MLSIQETHNESAFVMHVSCESCGSKDNAAIYDDGHTYCFGCQLFTPGDDVEVVAATKPKKLHKDLIQGEYADLVARSIREDTCRKYDYQVGEYQGRPVQIENYRDDNGEIRVQKTRDKDKNFTVLGDSIHMCLFGQHLWTTGKKLVVTEGAIDALSVSQAQHNKWPVVSVPNGAQSAKKALMKAWDFLGGFEEIILMFDSDEAGQKAALECAESLPVGKCKIAKLSGYKDPNEALQAGGEAEIVNAIWRAKDWRPDGIVSTTELRSSITDADEHSTITYPYPKLNELTRGIRPSTLVTICAGSGVGKSTLVTEIAYHLHRHDQKVGMLMLEEQNKRTVRGLIGLHIDKNIVQDYEAASKEEVLEAHDELFETQEIQLFDSKGSISLDIVINRIQYMAKAMGCTHVFLDHLSIVVSSMTGKVTDERRLIDDAMTRLRTMVQELDITLFLVSHLTRPQGKGHEAGGKVELSQLRGSHAIAQLADQCLGLQMDAEDPTNDCRDLVVLKNRFTGQVGWAGRLKYNRESGRLIDADSDNSRF